ncbi:Clavaminate synthase-like protein [Coprinellus micaceus]|uniref:Clavaminate synthase-like protein n=1 Tax=Coprinellus micaceus TaxID=71717 RepID=A0A4Y7TX62_COPMI|nr:Clavaminate synthase-like protein [Coprinellus micaceus]
MSTRVTLDLDPIPFPPSLNPTHFQQFGREVKGIHPRDLVKNLFIFQMIEKALYEHDLLLFRNVDLTPEEQYSLVKPFDSSAEQYGHGNDHEKSTKTILHSYLNTLPRVPQVQVIGHGTVYNHEGIPALTLKHGHHKTFHKTMIPSEDEEKFGATRFFRWHMDAALYKFDPPKVTALYGLRVPEGPPQVVRYDDGSGDELPVPLGTTAFISGKVMFDILPRKWKSFAVRARARYAPHPFEWIQGARAVSTGFGIVSEGLETPFEQLSEWEAEKRKTYPFLWKNPVTGSLHLQVHPMTITDIFVDPLPPSMVAEVQALYPEGGHINDLQDIRKILSEMQRPGIAPQLVYPHPWKEKDLVLFHNRGLVHSVVGLFKEDQIRLFHQCNLASSDAPRGPDQVDLEAWCGRDREQVP